MYNTFMLKLFRKKIVMKIILWGLVIIIVPAFVLWGGASMSRSKDKGPSFVGLVNNKKVSFDELSGAISGVRVQVILNYFNQPQTLDALLSNKPILAKLAWDRILMLDEVKRARIKVSNKELIESIRSHPLFLRNNVFDERFYSHMLKNSLGLEPRAFEEIFRENLALRKLSERMTSDIKISDEEALAEYKKDFEKIKVSYILLEPKDYTADIKIDENTVREFYDKNKSSLIVKSNIKGAVPDRQATFGELKDSIENHFKEIEARVTLKPLSEKIYSELSEKIASGGKTLEKAASELGYSIKDTDFFSLNDKVEALVDAPMVVIAASTLKDFELSKPLEISRGFIIFEVVDRKPADEEAFKKDKEEYSKRSREKRSNMRMETWLRGLEEKAKLAIKLEEIEKYNK